MAQVLTEAGVPVKPVAARAWAMRERIPAKYWSLLLENDPVGGLSFAELARDAAAKPQ